MVSIPFEFIVPYEQNALQQDLANMHLKVKSKQNLAELIQRYGYDAVKQRQDKIMRDKAHQFQRTNRGANNAQKANAAKASGKKASPHTPGAADSEIPSIENNLV